MIVKVFKEWSEEKVEFTSMGIRTWRTALDIEWNMIQYVLQYKYEISSNPDKWRTIKSSGLWLNNHFALGSFHGWYDGPHCCYSFGFLHFNWEENDNCKKCHCDVNDI